MNKKTLINIIVILTIGIMLFTMPIAVFAETNNSTDLDDLWDDWEDQGEKGDLIQDNKENTGTDSNTNTNTNNSANTNTNTNTSTNNTENKTNTDIPKAGLAENTVGVVAIAVLGIIAIYAYKKINEYKNI